MWWKLPGVRSAVSSTRPCSAPSVSNTNPNSPAWARYRPVRSATPGAARKVAWSFTSQQPLNFNIHYHAGEQVVTPARSTGVRKARGVLAPKLPQDYCWMWTNPSAVASPMSVSLQR